jgi:hypothetical protein
VKGYVERSSALWRGQLDLVSSTKAGYARRGLSV